MRLKDAVQSALEDFSLTLRYARSALNLLSDLKVPPTPLRFAVAYWHQTGTRPDLSLAINRLVGHDALTGAALDELHEQFFAEERDTAPLRQAGDRIQSSIGDVVGALTDAHQATKAYDDSLNGFRTALDSAANPDLDLATRAMIAETLRMAEVNRALEKRLQFTVRDIALLRTQLEQLERDAVEDSLTGIGNRKRFDSSLRELMARALNSQEPLTLLMIDIDHFKKFNDAHGHQVGDQVLKLVARQLITATTEVDVTARYGGEEFCVILPRTPLLVGVKLADRIRSDISDRKLVNRKSGKQIGKVTLSIGAAQFRPGESASELINRADEALYLAKDRGRNRVESESALTSAA